MWGEGTQGRWGRAERPPPCTTVTWDLGNYYWGVFSVVPSCSKATWLFWAGFFSSDSMRKMWLIPPLHSQQGRCRERPFSPWPLCHTAGPTRSNLRLKLFPQNKMVWPGHNLGDDHVETLEFKTNVAMLPKNKVGDVGSYKSTGSRLLVSTYSVYTLWARSLYFGSIFCKVGLVTPPTSLAGCEDPMVCIFSNIQVQKKGSPNDSHYCESYRA